MLKLILLVALAIAVNGAAGTQKEQYNIASDRTARALFAPQCGPLCRRSPPKLEDSGHNTGYRAPAGSQPANYQGHAQTGPLVYRSTGNPVVYYAVESYNNQPSSYYPSVSSSAQGNAVSVPEARALFAPQCGPLCRAAQDSGYSTGYGVPAGSQPTYGVPAGSQPAYHQGYAQTGPLVHLPTSNPSVYYGVESYNNQPSSYYPSVSSSAQGNAVSVPEARALFAPQCGPLCRAAQDSGYSTSYGVPAGSQPTYGVPAGSQPAHYPGYSAAPVVSTSNHHSYQTIAAPAVPEDSNLSSSGYVLLQKREASGDKLKKKAPSAA